MRRRVTGVFAAWVGAFFALNILLVSSLWPQLRYLETLSTQYAANSTLIAKMTAALEATRTLRPDVIVLDISLPDLSGLEIAGRLRETGSTAAVVFVTVHHDETLVLAAKAAGGIGFVVKRRIASDLLLAVREALAGRPFVSPVR